MPIDGRTKQAVAMTTILILLISTAGLAGCLEETAAITCGEGTHMDGTTCVADETDETGSIDWDGDWKEFNIEAAQFEFIPSDITVNEGDHVRLIFTSTASEQSQYNMHSFSMNAYDIAVNLPVGETVTVEFVADKSGEFDFDCSIFCGDFHNNMIGTVTVVAAQTTEVVAEPEIGNHTALDVATEIYNTTTSPGGVPEWVNGDLMLIIEREAEAVVFVDTSTDEIVGRVMGLGFQPHTVVYDHECENAFLISRGGWLSKIALDDLSVLGYVKVGESSRGTALSANGNWIAASNYEPEGFAIVNTETMEIAMMFQIPVPYSETGEREFSRVASLLDTPSGYFFAAMKDTGQVFVIDADETRWGETPFPIKAVYNDQGGLLHDAFITPDGHYYVLASQLSHHMVVIDAWTLEEVGLITVGQKPHPGPGAVWGKYIFTPSILEGNLSIIDSETWETSHYVSIGGGALFTRTLEFGDPVEGSPCYGATEPCWETNPDNLTYPYIWWDSVLATDMAINQEVYVLDASVLYQENVTNADLLAATHTLQDLNCPGRTLHPEFSHDGTKVYVSCWAEEGYLSIYESTPGVDGVFDLLGTITGIANPTGTFGAGLRAEEIGV